MVVRLVCITLLAAAILLIALLAVPKFRLLRSRNNSGQNKLLVKKSFPRREPCCYCCGLESSMDNWTISSRKRSPDDKNTYICHNMLHANDATPTFDFQHWNITPMLFLREISCRKGATVSAKGTSCRNSADAPAWVISLFPAGTIVLLIHRILSTEHKLLCCCFQTTNPNAVAWCCKAYFIWGCSL